MIWIHFLNFNEDSDIELVLPVTNYAKKIISKVWIAKFYYLLRWTR